jgi:hypothetical protein
VDNNDLYQLVLFVSAVAGCLGALAFLGPLPWLPHWLALLLALVLGYIYGEIQAAYVCQLPRVRERGEVTTSGFCKVGCPYAITSVLIVILIPVFIEARKKAYAAGRTPLPPIIPVWAPLAVMAFPVVLSGIIAVVGWGLHASERRRGRS